MTNQSENEIINELVKSKELIESKLNQKIDHFAYPNGNFNPRIIELVKKAGYKSACAVKHDMQNSCEQVYCFKRINMNEGAYIDPGGRFSREIFSRYLEKSLD
jgi:peptidoglycan/xylan/chitin deacetylase (PgdA/CDA1 family)